MMSFLCTALRYATYLTYPWFAGVGLMLAFYALSPVIPQASFAARATAYILGMILCSAYGITISAILTLIGQNHSAQYAVARAFELWMRITTGITCEIDDPTGALSKIRPAVFIGPHQSELDILFLGAVFPKHCSVTAKKSLKKMPILGWFMTLSGAVFIDRANSKDARAAMQGAADEMTRRKQNVWMFPEGTRSYSEEPGLLPFKKGAFHLAVQAKVPIVPVVISNYSDIFSMKKLRFKSGVIKIRVLPAIETKNLTSADVDDLTRDTRTKMEKTMLELTALQRGRPVKLDERLAAMSSGNGVVKASGIQATTNSLS